jgi:hypothetical protein
MSRRTPALLHEENEALERRVASLEAKRPLDLERVDAAIGRIGCPEVLADRLGDAFRYSQRVEAEVASLSLEILLPYATDDFDGRFLAVWVPDELGHAAAQDLLLRALGLPIDEPRGAGAVPVHNRIAGRLGRMSSRAYEMVSMTYHAIGAINERMAMGAYGRMAEIATELGENEVAEVLLEPLRRDESGHLGYYRAYARQLRSRLADWQLAVVRTFIVATYAPVGAGEHADKAPFGRVLAALEDDPENPSIGGAVHDIAAELLAQPGHHLKPFVVRAMRRCVDLARAEAR